MTHDHIFDYPPPAGPTSIGVCRICGEEREGKNFIEDGSHWRAQPVKPGNGFVSRGLSGRTINEMLASGQIWRT